MQVSDWAVRFSYESIAPLGRPVVPEVYMISAVESSGTSTGSWGAPSSAIASA